jgi:hypothetical protein
VISQHGEIERKKERKKDGSNFSDVFMPITVEIEWEQMQEVQKPAHTLL